MNVLAILKDFTFRCKSVFENTTTKMSKKVPQLADFNNTHCSVDSGQSQFYPAVALWRSYSQDLCLQFPNFKTSVDWMKVNIGMAQDCFGPSDDMAVAVVHFKVRQPQPDVWHRPFLVRGGTTCQTRSGDNGDRGSNKLSKHTCVTVTELQDS